MYDRYQRKIEYVRISLTDRCNLRCRYCMPEDGVEKLRHEDILRFDEIVRIVRALASLGVRKVRLTGGEPLFRRNVVELVREIRSVPGIESVALTTNGVLLKAASFTELTRRPFFVRVEDGIEAIAATGLRDVKFNCVPIAGVNEAELPELVARFTRERPWKFRFIELMPIGCAYEACRWRRSGAASRLCLARCGPSCRSAACTALPSTTRPRALRGRSASSMRWSINFVPRATACG